MNTKHCIKSPSHPKNYVFSRGHTRDACSLHTLVCSLQPAYERMQAAYDRLQGVDTGTHSSGVVIYEYS